MYVLFYFEDQLIPDLGAIFTGSFGTRTEQVVWALPAVYGEPTRIEPRHLEVVAKLSPKDWVEIENDHINDISFLASIGVAILENGDSKHHEYRRREDVLRHQQWNLYAAMHHFLNRWDNVHLFKGTPTDLNEVALNSSRTLSIIADFVNTHGYPPGHFAEVSTREANIELPLDLAALECDPLASILRQRKTCREFDVTSSVDLSTFSQLLYIAFGCHGLIHVYDTIWGIKRTSPSGGGLHPIETYVLAIRVEGLAPGLYQYDVARHQLNCIEQLAITEAGELANEFTAGQSYPRSAAALCIMTARFYRNHWKYRRHPKSYPVLYMDCAHMSQTFYIYCAHVGLGAFVTGAINSQNIERRLGLDPYQEGPLLITGCGVPARTRVGLDPEYQPYSPRVTPFP